jgi:hypothetical protein
MMRAKKSNYPAYENRLILFVDFLGFKESVGKTEGDPAALKRLLDAMDAVGEIGTDSIFKSHQVTQFSDSIVLSYRIDEKSGVFWLLNEIALGVVTLVLHGHLLRGAVTIGELYHDQRHVVGPAMVRAYELESKVAKFPRVIIDERVIEIARRPQTRTHDPDEEEEYVRHFMTQDADGHYFFDYVSWNSVVAVTGANNDGYPEYLGKLATFLESGLSHEEPSVQEKYLWLHPQYVKAIDLVCGLPTDNAYRLENPEHCDAIESLPTFHLLATSASQAVDAWKAKLANGN